MYDSTLNDRFTPDMTLLERIVSNPYKLLNAGNSYYPVTVGTSSFSQTTLEDRHAVVLYYNVPHSQTYRELRLAAMAVSQCVEYAFCQLGILHHIVGGVT